MDLPLLAARYARRPGMHPTPLPGLHIIRADEPMPRLYVVHKPSLCFIAQGAKEVTVGDRVLRYATNEFLYSTVELPMTGEIVRATSAKPYLCLVLAIEPSLVFDLVTASETVERRAGTPPREAVFVGRSESMTDAFGRLLACLRTPVDTNVLAPSVVREITYHLLRGPYGDVVRDLGIADSQTQRIAAVIERLKADYAKPLRTAELARIAGMSESSLHAHFKKVTTLSPLQYQKHLRLYEARRLLLGETSSAADAGFRVGYQSASQFSREYARYFGQPPITDTKRPSLPAGDRTRLRASR